MYMKGRNPLRYDGCCNIRRRNFLADCGMGFTGLVLGAMLEREGIVRAEVDGPWQRPDGTPHFAPKAKSVIWLFMIGGTSHMESFDPKPALNKYAGKSIAETPYKDTLDSPYVEKGVRAPASQHKVRQTIFPLQIGYRKRGESGIEVSDWWPHLGGCIDDIAVVRSVWTTDNNHGAQLQFHTGRHVLEGSLPTVGSWVHYGLGSLNENLPQFVALGEPVDTCCGGIAVHGAGYLGPEHNGVQLAVDPENPLPFASPETRLYKEEQEAEFQLLAELNRLAGVEYPEDRAMRARIRSYELAFRMQTAVPEVFRFQEESKATRRLYGLDQENTRPFGEICLTARRLVERGVRFVQVYHGSNGGAGSWDSHKSLKSSHSKRCAEVDRPIAALLKDLKQRGMLDETLVVWATEFGRTPGSQPAEGGGEPGRDHHPYGFSVWLAGGGVKGGITHGATDELGFHAVENRHYVTDIHASVLHQLGLDPHKLEVPGRKRLKIDYGDPIHSIMA